MEHPSSLPMRFSYDESTVEHLVQEHGGVRRHRWTVRNVEPLWREPMAPPSADLVPKVRIFPGAIRWEGHEIDTGSWAGIAAWYDELARDRVDVGGELGETAARLAGGADDESEKIRLLYEYLQQQIVYVAVELGIGGWQPHPSLEVFLKRYGDCKDKATLLISMLRAVGIDADPVLVRTRDAGLMDSSLPALAFNHAIVAVPRESGYLFLDPTSRNTPYGDLPWSDQGIPVLVVAAMGGAHLETTPLFPPDHNRIERRVSARLDVGGVLTGDYVVEVWGQSRARMASLVQGSAAMRREELSRYLGEQIPGAILEGQSVTEPEGPDEPMRVTLQFHASRYAKRVGDRRLLPPQLARVDDLAAVGTLNPRAQAVLFPYLFRDATTARLELPEGLAPSALPEPSRIEAPGLRYEAEYGLEGSDEGASLVIRRTLEVTRREIAPEVIEEWQEAIAALIQENARAVSLGPAGS